MQVQALEKAIIRKDAEIEVRYRCFANMCIRVSSSHLIPFYLMNSVKLNNNLYQGEQKCIKED